MLVLGLLGRLVLGGGVGHAQVLDDLALGNAGQLGELLQHLVHLAGAEHDLHGVALNEAHHAVKRLDASHIDLGRIAHADAQARHARRVGRHVALAAEQLEQLLT